MGNPNVLTKSTSPVSVPNLVAGLLTGNVGGIPNPDAIFEAFNVTLLPLLVATLLKQKYSPNTKSSFRKQYDYIIVGGGAAGSVLANRLSEKKCVSVLLLEAGKHPSALTEVPALALLMKITDVNWNFRTEPQEHTSEGQFERRILYDCGKGLGGSSLINIMLYCRGNKQDYDDWKAMGAEGWGYEDVLPYFLKLENNTDADIASNRECHNVSGPMTFSRVRYTSPLRQPMIDGAKSLGYTVVDTNCGNQLGFSDMQTFIRHGQRCSAAKAYLVPVDDRPNLDIVTEAFVTKILIKKGVACGVCFLYKGSSRRCVKAKREVILSAGTVNSVKVLMLSGIGPRETLKRLNIKQHADLPVGQNLQDHVMTALCFTTPGLKALANLVLPSTIEHYVTNRSGPLATPSGAFSIGFHRSDDALTPKDVPNFQSYFVETDSIGARIGLGLTPLTYESLFLPYETQALLFCLSSVVNPKSRGYVTINSTDPSEDPLIDPKFLSHPQDKKDLIAGLKMCLKIAETPQVKAAGVEYFKTKVFGCENVTDGIDKYLECYVRKLAFSSWHPACTVKMGSKDDPTAVVDPKFRVKRIRRLRVIDASTMPKVVSGNIMVPTMMMAEKGADIIKKTIRCC